MSTDKALAVKEVINEDEPVSAEGFLVRSRESRKALFKRLSDTAEIAIEHIENGSFEIVEQALTECKDDLCQMGQTIKQDRKRRRGRKNETAVQAQSG